MKGVIGEALFRQAICKSVYLLEGANKGADDMTNSLILRSFVLIVIGRELS